MAENEGLRVVESATIVAILPDVCLTPPAMTPVPYSILARLSDGVRYESAVRMGGCFAMTMSSRVDKVSGDEAGKGGGVESGVITGWCRPITNASTVRAQGAELTQHTALFWMNCDGADGPGNTIGRAIHVVHAAATTLNPSGGMNGPTNPRVVPETAEEHNACQLVTFGLDWFESAAAAFPWMAGAATMLAGLLCGVGQSPGVRVTSPKQSGKIGGVPGYSEEGATSWRASNDQTFRDAVEKYNQKYGYEPGDPQYWTPELLKAQAMVESGGEGDEKAFLTDPLQVNVPGDFTSDKKRVLGLERDQQMNPSLSAEKALLWLRHKAMVHDDTGAVVEILDQRNTIRRYNGRTDMHASGKKFSEWYADRIMDLAAQMAP